MGWEHGTFGRGAYDAFLADLRNDKYNDFTIVKLDNPNQPEYKRLCRGRDLDCKRSLPLRMARFNYAGRRDNWYVVEEVLAVDDRDCDGASIVSLIVYPEGCRPAVSPPLMLEA